MYNVAVIGSTGAVGREILKVLEAKQFPIREISLLASKRSAGKKLLFKGEEREIQDIEQFPIENIDFAFFSAGSEVSAQWAERFAEAGAIVIDNTSLFRMRSDVPLIVPEINGALVEGMEKGLIANPNCSTIQMVLALEQIEKLFGLRKIVVSTYQSVSGSGQKGMNALKSEIEGGIKAGSVYARQIAYNVIPQIDDFTESGFTKEEMKMINETKKIMDLPHLDVNATCVRVPVMRGHSETVYVETQESIDLDRLLQNWENTKNLIVAPQQMDYPTPQETEGHYETYVGRIRKDLNVDNGLSFWVVSDNLLKGAALNSVQIAEHIVNFRKIGHKGTVK